MIANPFPYAMLPATMQHAVTEAHAQTQAPPDLICMAALAVASLACQHVVDVVGGDERPAATALNIVVAAESGERKTAVFRRLLRSVTAFQTEAREQVEDDIRRHKARHEAWSAQVAGVKARITKNAAKGLSDDVEAANRLVELATREPVPPLECALLFESATPAALNRSLAKVYPSAGMFSSEAGDIVNGDSFRSLGHHNSNWDGQTASRDRLDERITPRWPTRVTMLLMIQGGELKRFLDKRGEMARSSGFLARALIGYPPSTIGTRFVGVNSMRVAPAEAFHDRVTELLARAHQRIKDGCRRDLMYLDAAARIAWEDFYNHIEARSGPTGDLVSVREFASKIAEQALRIAAIVQHFDIGGLIIDKAHMQAGIAIANYFLVEHLRMFRPPPPIHVPDEQILLNHLWTWYGKTGQSEWSLKKIEASAPCRLRGQHGRTRRALNNLLAAGNVYGHAQGRGGSYFGIVLNPVMNRPL